MTYLGSGDPARRRTGYHPEWLDNLADDVTLEGSVLNGAVHGAEAVRTLLAYAQTLYEYQEFNFAGPYGDNGFIEDYTSRVQGQPIDVRVSGLPSASVPPPQSRRTARRQGAWAA